MRPVEIDPLLEQFEHIDFMYGLITDPSLLRHHYLENSRRWMHSVYEQGKHLYICVHRHDSNPQLAQVCPSWSTHDIPQIDQRV